MAKHQRHGNNTFDAMDGLMQTEIKHKNMKSKYVMRSSNYIPGDFVSSLINTFSIVAILIVLGIGIFKREYFILLPIIFILDR